MDVTGCGMTCEASVMSCGCEANVNRLHLAEFLVYLSQFFVIKACLGCDPYAYMCYVYINMNIYYTYVLQSLYIFRNIY